MTSSANLAWTGERMVPNASDVWTELYHWQRYLFFRPWYLEARVVDAACGEGYGTGYASAFALSACGVDISQSAVKHAQRKYRRATFFSEDVCEFDYNLADIVISFETIEHLPNPAQFFKATQKCKGAVVVSTPNRNHHSPGNTITDKPWNEFHTVEWTPTEFAEFVRSESGTKNVTFFSQEKRWPGLIRLGLDEDAAYTIAVIGDAPPAPHWPKLGIVIPTYNGAQSAIDCVIAMSRSYPGEIEFAIVANGCENGQIEFLKNQQKEIPHILHLVIEVENLGYGVGSNHGLAALRQKGDFDYYVISNDDVIPGIDCISELVSAMEALQEAGLNPGAIGPVSNNVHGQQQVTLGRFHSYEELIELAKDYHLAHTGELTEVSRIRGLFYLLTKEAIDAVGGFDPRFGLGNFEDDDHNWRLACAGYSLWIARGAFLYHRQSETFDRLNLDYEASIERNWNILAQKWKIDHAAELFANKETPEGVEIFLPLKAA